MTGAVGARRIVVFGGNGLLGSAICRSAVRMGHAVTSISRRGNVPLKMIDSVIVVTLLLPLY